MVGVSAACSTSAPLPASGVQVVFLDEAGELVPVDRPHGRNTAGLIVGMVTRPTAGHPEGMSRIAMFGDPTKALGTVAENAADRAHRRRTLGRAA